MRRVLIVANGPAPSPAFLKRAARGAAAVLCADGGYVAAAKAGLKVDVIVGDLDSLPRKTKLKAGVRVLLDDDPNASDLEKAVRLATRSRFAPRWGGPELWVAGALGGRLDQTLANLQIVGRASRGARLRLIDEHGTAEAVEGKVSFKTRPGERVTLLPLDGTARVVTSGLRFPLRGERLEPGSRGLSNVATGRKATLRVRGRLWLVRSAPPWQLA